MSDVFNRVHHVLCEQLGFTSDEAEKAKVNLEANLLSDLGADSLDQVEIVMALEDEFGIEISDDDGEAIKTVADVVNLVTRLTGEKAAE